MRIKMLFTSHPTSVGETYTEHMGHAARFGARLVLAGMACLIHSLLPFVFVRTARDTVSELHARMVVSRRGPMAGKGQEMPR